MCGPGGFAVKFDTFIRFQIISTKTGIIIKTGETQVPSTVFTLFVGTLTKLL